ncbi:MAG TPA: hypothetical protein VGE35_03425 [Candidatus Paceibacterota bacterium]
MTTSSTNSQGLILPCNVVVSLLADIARKLFPLEMATGEISVEQHWFFGPFCHVSLSYMPVRRGCPKGSTAISIPFLWESETSNRPSEQDMGNAKVDLSGMEVFSHVAIMAQYRDPIPLKGCRDHSRFVYMQSALAAHMLKAQARAMLEKA